MPPAPGWMSSLQAVLMLEPSSRNEARRGCRSRAPATRLPSAMVSRLLSVMRSLLTHLLVPLPLEALDATFAAVGWAAEP